VCRRTLARLSIHVMIRFFRRGQRMSAPNRRFLVQILKGSGTIFATFAALLLNLFVHVPAGLKAEEVNLSSATIIGAALALVLSLSTIPAQRAAEAFSSAILNLYARDRALLLVFLTLVGTNDVVSPFRGKLDHRARPKICDYRSTHFAGDFL
jgi:hypothetical protein